MFQLTFVFPSMKMSQNYLHKYQVHSLLPLCTQRELAVSKVGSSHSSNRCSDSLQNNKQPVQSMNYSISLFNVIVLSFAIYSVAPTEQATP